MNKEEVNLDVYYTMYASNEGEVASSSCTSTLEEFLEDITNDIREMIPALLVDNINRNIVIVIDTKRYRSNAPQEDFDEARKQDEEAQKRIGYGLLHPKIKPLGDPIE